jgi:hypothetical protein
MTSSYDSRERLAAGYRGIRSSNVCRELLRMRLVKEPAGKGRKLGRSRDEGADGHIRGKVAVRGFLGMIAESVLRPAIEG